jgi:hypothetical protein
MNSLFEIMNLPVNTIFDRANQFLTPLPDIGLLPAAGSGLAFASAPGAPGRGNIPEGVLTSGGGMTLHLRRKRPGRNMTDSNRLPNGNGSDRKNRPYGGGKTQQAINRK